MSVLPRRRCVNYFRCCAATSAHGAPPQIAQMTREKKPPVDSGGFLNAGNESGLLDCFEHFECGLVGADEKTLEVFTQTFALQRIATSALLFSSHGDLLNVNAISESIEL